MVICPACGTENSAERRSCAACGVALDPRAETATCPQCAGAAAAGDAFCAGCGRPVAVAASRRMQTAGISGGADETRPSSTLLGDDLDLPDWLKQAAAETPANPTGADPAMPGVPAGFVVAGVDQPAGIAGANAGAVEPAERDEPLPPLPTNGLAESMPDWLRPAATEASDATQVEPPSTGTAPPADQRPAASAEPINPRSMITEDDLPDWIRQLVETEAAQKSADEAQRRETVERAAAAGARDTVPAAGHGLLDERTAGAANPWLARRDRPVPQDRVEAARTSVFAQVVEKHVAAQASPVAGAAAPPAAEPEAAAGAAIVPEAPVTVAEVPANRLRTVLLVATLVALVVLAALYVVSAGLIG